VRARRSASGTPAWRAALPRRALVLAAALAGLAGCLGPVASLHPPADATTAKPVFVVQHGWHTRIAVRSADVPAGLWPERDDLGPAAYLEVGWGDAAFYQSEDPTVAQAIDAVIRPTPAVLHVAALDALAAVPVVRVDVSPAGFERLVRFVHDSHARAASGRAPRLRPGFDPRSAFYPATGRYHAFNTSNTWTARALRATGAPVTPAWSMFASVTMLQARRVGRPLP
jgi:uncharacterized protein (TIGR02117 family)